MLFRYWRYILIVVVVIVAATYSLQALAALVALFAGARPKTSELIKQQDEQAETTRVEIDNVRTAGEAARETAVQSAETEIDQWLDS